MQNWAKFEFFAAHFCERHFHDNGQGLPLGLKLRHVHVEKFRECRSTSEKVSWQKKEKHAQNIRSRLQNGWSNKYIIANECNILEQRDAQILLHWLHHATHCQTNLCTEHQMPRLLLQKLTFTFSALALGLWPCMSVALAYWPWPWHLWPC